LECCTSEIPAVQRTQGGIPAARVKADIKKNLTAGCTYASGESRVNFRNLSAGVMAEEGR